MAKPKGSQPFGRAAREIVARRGPAVLDHVEGLHARDPVAVHQTRVASRRLRAALEAFAPCFPAKRHRRLLRLVKATADDLGEARDLDVQIGYLEGYLAGCSADDRPGVESLIALLAGERDRAQERVLPAAQRLEDEEFEHQLRALVRKGR